MKGRLTFGRKRQRVIRLPGTAVFQHPIHHIPSPLRPIVGLLTLIAVGTLLLWLLPGVTTRPITFMQALFTATSAVTVTGMALLTTSTDFTFAGQIILLLLIQMGGLGYMALVALLLRASGRRVSLPNRLLLADSLGLQNPSLISHYLGRILTGMFVIEALGAAALFVYWRQTDIVPSDRVLFYAIFHAVAAFCNAGFDLFWGTPAYPNGIPNDNLTLIILGVLVILGGLGLPVFHNLLMYRRQRRLSLHTRLTLLVTLALMLVGWVALYLPEATRGVAADLTLDEKLVQTWFQSVSARTAGFPGLENFALVQPESQLVLVGLMFVGSGPASMGGGITTGTLVVLLAVMWSFLRGTPGVNVFKRSIPARIVKRATAVLIVSLFVCGLATWLLLLTHPFELGPALFEVVSAFSTCGLTLGLTSQLNPIGQLIIIFMMFWGRLGALTIVLVLLSRSRESSLLHYPEEPVLIG